MILVDFERHACPDRSTPPGRWLAARASAAPLAAIFSIALALCACAGPTGSIGAVLYKDPASGRVSVEKAPPDMTGARAGLEPGDEVLSVDGVDVRDLSRDELQARLRGDVATSVELTIARGERVEHLTVIRGPYRKERASQRPPRAR
jgi:S1-C subfamily serine protease